MKELKYILKNLGIMIVLTGSIIFFIFYIYFPLKTNHGDTITVPNLVGKVGHIRVFAAFASLASLSILIHALFVNPYIWTIGRFLTGRYLPPSKRLP